MVCKLKRVQHRVFLFDEVSFNDMVSGPGAVFDLVFFRALTTSFVLKVMGQHPGLRLETFTISWVLLSD